MTSKKVTLYLTIKPTIPLWALSRIVSFKNLINYYIIL